jgi:hypothetical protein
VPLFHRAQPPAAAAPPPVPFRAGHPAGLAPETAAPQPKFTGTYTLLADVSEFQPSIADAAYLKWSKAIVIRAAYGDAHDDTAWYGGARRAALHAGGAQFIGIYQYLVAGQDGAAQANALHALVGPLQKGEVLIADFEQGEKAMLTAWYNRMLALGYPDKFVWTYTGANFGQAQDALPVQWLADYTAVEPASAHTLWQFTDNYAVPGVGHVDCSVYHGSITRLGALAYPGTVTPAPQPAPAPKPASAEPVIGTQGGWRWCEKCELLAHGPGACPKGGQHKLGTWEYFLPYSHPA